ncbi:MAG TPA: dienelactone hydrolase family protein [Acidobacteriota bacterium]|nr:dienelactone hydrolase family protein [Acidobacteriota bacterium]
MKKLLVLGFILCLATLTFAGGNMVQFKSGDDTASGYLSMPEGKGPFPGMIVIQEWFGVNDQMKGLADRFAGLGYAALAVDLYRGKVATNDDEAHQLSSGLPEDRAVRDLKAGYAYLQSLPNVSKNKIGSIGWCMGGHYSGALAIAEPTLAACVIYYGSQPTDSQTLAKINAPVIGFFGGADQGVTPELAKKFEAQMKALHKDVTINIYDGAGHAFAREGGPKYNETAAKDSWSKTVSFLQAHLKQ